jgi:hypothetical protein
MGVRHNRSHYFPTWVRTLGAILDDGTIEIKARCRTCQRSRAIDIAALAARLGRDYSLCNRRTRCRLTPGCRGWNVFGYSTGTWVHHLFDPTTDAAWARRDAGE